MGYFSLNKASITIETTTTTTTPSPVESMTTDEEDYYFGENASVERAVASVEPYWASTLCKMRHSRNILVVAVRKYLDVTSYYVPIAGKDQAYRVPISWVGATFCLWPSALSRGRCWAGWMQHKQEVMPTELSP